MTDQVIANQEYDVFLSYATEDREWAQMLAERLRSSGVRVWFDEWELQSGDHGYTKLNDGLKYSRKLVAVWTPNYFRDDKVWTLAESYAKQDKDLLARERPLIPVLRLDCEIEPLFRPLIYLDCRRDDDFELRFRQLIEAIDLPRREFQTRDRDEFEFREHELTKVEHRQMHQEKVDRFDDEVARLYGLLGFDVKPDLPGIGSKNRLQIRQKIGRANFEAFVDCENKIVDQYQYNRI